jgi:hypothetical protein
MNASTSKLLELKEKWTSSQVEYAKEHERLMVDHKATRRSGTDTRTHMRDIWLFIAVCAGDNVKCLFVEKEVRQISKHHRRVLLAYTKHKASTVRLFKSFGEIPPDIALTARQQRRHRKPGLSFPGPDTPAFIAEELFLDAATQVTLDASMTALDGLSAQFSASRARSAGLKDQLKATTCGMQTHAHLPCFSESSADLDRREIAQDILTNKIRQARLKDQIIAQKAATRLVLNNNGVEMPSDKERGDRRAGAKRRTAKAAASPDAATQANLDASLTVVDPATQADLFASMNDLNKRHEEVGVARATRAELNHRWAEATSGM